jgi:hypothetical protein
MEWRGEYGLEGGTPIREEVLERRDESVMTRNSYGAHCLNTENVAIADIDFPQKKPARFPLISSLLLALALPWLWVTPLTWSLGAALLMLLLASIGLVFWSGLKQWLHARQAQRNKARQPPPAEIALAKVQAFCADHPTGACASTKRPRACASSSPTPHSAHLPPRFRHCSSSLRSTRCMPCCAISSSAFAPASAASPGAWA